MARAGKHATRIEDRDAIVRAAQKALDAAEIENACALARRAVEAADGAPDGNARARARRILAAALLDADRADEARKCADESARIARASRSPKEQALAEILTADIARWHGDCLAAIRHTARAKALAVRSRDAAALRYSLVAYGISLARIGDGERAREQVDAGLALQTDADPPASAYRVVLEIAQTRAAAGRYEEALRLADRAEQLAQRAGLRSAAWPIALVRSATFVEVGALDAARELLDRTPDPPGTPPSRRAQRWLLRAMIAHAAGERPEMVERHAAEGLGIDGIDPLTSMSLERVRAAALFARGRVDEAERVAVEIVGRAGRGGAHGIAGAAMALAARCARPEAALLRWLGALALSTNGVSARVEHEALMALTMEPDPIGMLARTYLATFRSRLAERTPAAHRAALRRALNQVEAKLAQARKERRAQSEMALSDEALRAKDDVGIAGSSPPLVRALATLARAAKGETSIVLLGETGSGKELFARLAHRLSARRHGPFVALNCAAIPEPLLEAELFGHERGAFTGAERARPGLFVEAQGGTLFLDEVGEMSPAMQAKLLRVLEEREVRAIGGGKARKVDVRVIAATHRELSTMVAQRTFREDLYYRLAAITVRVPSLRERPEDVPVIAKALLARDQSTAKYRIDVPGLTALSEHSWPGNVRELANVLRVAAALSEDVVIGREPIADAMKQGRARDSIGDAGARSLEETTLASLRSRHRAELRELVGRAIAAADGNKLRAARALGISRQGLYRVLAEFDD